MTPTSLEARWHQLTSSLLPDEAFREAAYRQLVRAYAAPERHYHSLEHIRRLLKTLDEHRDMVHDATVVELAIWFHDAVYNPLRSDNEARSAQLAKDFLENTSLSAERQARVGFLIERTKDHSQPQPPNDTDLHFFLDADLQILGAPEADYWQYARQVRQEYRLVPDLLYRPGRRKVLEKLLASAPLYRTALFHQQLEVAARHNLQAELAKWEQGRL
ncbi:hypothetical protein [Hymenobacter sp. DG25A]|uniref:HD domain-containing protein n=1 Tax=Hymenobacter sp. DG25A TaxID=1385663 RepID=UPI0006BD5DC8|nr:hypothetical protein [Hymenobacter sp. DG25A]ALD19978.1 hypothetical protein AM218_00485 [Hymenobacter sp. DG25A]